MSEYHLDRSGQWFSCIWLYLVVFANHHMIGANNELYIILISVSGGFYFYGQHTVNTGDPLSTFRAPRSPIHHHDLVRVFYHRKGKWLIGVIKADLKCLLRRSKWRNRVALSLFLYFHLFYSVFISERIFGCRFLSKSSQVSLKEGVEGGGVGEALTRRWKKCCQNGIWWWFNLNDTQT